MDFCNISLGLKRKETNYWGVRRGGSAEHCVSISVAVCIERALLQPKWWHPLLQPEPQPNCAARVVGATSGGSHCCSKSGGSQCLKVRGIMSIITTTLFTAKVVRPLFEQ